MPQYDLVVQLGSQVMFIDGQYKLAPHTRMRTEASAIVLKTGIAPRLIISGGSNFGVRYTDTEIMKPPIFSFEAFASSDFTRKSESGVIKDVLVCEFGINADRIFAEGLSATTEENVLFVEILLNRRPMFTGNEKIGILTLLYHMEKAFSVWRRILGTNVSPLFAENVLAHNDSVNVERIVQYYSTPKGGKQYDTEQIRQLLIAGESLVKMLPT
jgi:uncharacterized SAM-binding protein YcdF (DUF218 family)